MKNIEIVKECDSKKIAAYLSSLGKDNRKNMAVLGRIHAILKKLSGELHDLGIEHKYVGKNSALTHSEGFIRFHAFLKLIVNNFDNLSFLLIKDIVGLEKKEYRAIRFNALQQRKSHFQMWMELASESEWKEFFKRVGSFDLRDFVNVMEDTYVWPFDVSGIADFIRKWEDENPMVRDTAADEGPIQNYLNWLATFDLQEEVENEADSVLQLMTIHAAKGLEWPRVAIIGVNEGILPSKQAIASGDVSEERRLCYVAMTRARDELSLLIRPEVTLMQNGGERNNPMSRFVKECING